MNPNPADGAAKGGAACAAFERWLDDGRPESAAVAARAHSGACAACAERLAADLAIEALLAAPPPPAPASLSAAVMDRVERASRARAVLPAPALAWGSWRLYRWGERFASAGPRRAHPLTLR